MLFRSVIGFILSQILFMGEYAFDPDYLTFDIEGILINIVAPLIIVIIGDVLLVGQLKTANEATHADEYCGELDLVEKHDTFSHTETTVVMKDVYKRQVFRQVDLSRMGSKI